MITFVLIFFLSVAIFKVSFDLAEYTANVDALGTLRILDAIKTCGMEHRIKFYQVTTSFMVMLGYTSKFSKGWD